QGNWNGIIGKITLKAEAPVFFRDVQVYPDLKNRQAKITLQLQNGLNRTTTGTILVSAKSFNSQNSDATKVVTATFKVNANDTSTVDVILPFGKGMLTWDEFNPALYKLNVILQTKEGLKNRAEVQFGMREFTIKSKQFLINGRPVFLRGTVNNCEFPLTGYPSMMVEGWEKIFRKAKDYGLNHMRFHSWCPPEAAFIAADKTGFYLQPEGPSWPNHGPKIGLGQPIDQYLYEETERMAQRYGNYASFTMLSAGNEPAGNQVAYLNAFVDYWKKKDRRRVYTGMSVGGSWPIVPNAEFQVRGGVRGLAWDKKPESVSDYSEGISKFTMPFVAHEMGQWCAFPNFDEIKNYNVVYQAKNLELFQQDLIDRGMGNQASDFLLASGKLQVLCYKAEIEKALRTPGYAGFQLLGLQDFPGQGTALVGVLNPFWEEKGYITAKEFRRFCNTTVPLVGLKKFVFTNDEVLDAAVSVFHSGQAPLNGAVMWNIKSNDGKLIAAGTFPQRTIENGNGIPIGTIKFPLSGINQAQKLTLQVSVDRTEFSNDWDVWVYPAMVPKQSGDIYYTTTLDEKAKAVLQNGGKVFLNASGKVIKGKEIAMHFLPVFWNTSWFKMRPPHVTGMLIQTSSSAFADFPTDSHSNLQWWEIANRSQVMILEDFPPGFKPLVQPIDTWFVNRRLALIYEARVGKGKLVVSSADLRSDLVDRPAAKQLFSSIQKYMSSDKFNPKEEVSLTVVEDVFLHPSKESVNMYTKDSPDELKPSSNQNKN
ncbi:MAG: beta-glucuronidase, partial [Chitinophagaceae bacterium]